MLLLSIAFAAAPPPSLAGTWQLDAEHSSDAAPLLAKMGVPSVLASLSGSVTQVITLGDESITVQVKSAFKESTETMSLAPGAQASGSIFGAAYTVKPEVVGSTIHATGTIDLSGVPTPFESRRFVVGDTMHSVYTVGSGAETTTLDRVFNRVK